MSDKLIPENGVLLKSRYDCYNNQKRCDKADNNYSHELEFVPENYKTEIMKNKVVNNSQSALQFVPKQFVAKVIRHKKCMIKLLILAFLYLLLFLIDIKLKKCAPFFLQKLLCQNIASIDIRLN